MTRGHNTAGQSLVTLLVMALLALPALADTIVLKNGSRFEGHITLERQDRVILQTAQGTITFHRRQIRRIIHAPWKPPSLQGTSPARHQPPRPRPKPHRRRKPRVQAVRKIVPKGRKALRPKAPKQKGHAGWRHFNNKRAH